MTLKHNQNGFSLIEMLVSVFILTIITTLSITNYRAGEKKNLLNLESNVLLSNIRKMQNMVLNGSKFDGHEMPFGGYGIHFESTGYTIFSDDNSNKKYDAGEAASAVVLQKISLAETGNNKNLIFFPPKGQVCVNQDLCPICDCDIKNGGQYSIILTYDETGDAKTVTLNQISGRAEIE
ncbi:MAG: prepilin-type N-terminal cleavage/methylation domain-containing protein [bacterium]